MISFSKYSFIISNAVQYKNSDETRLVWLLLFTVHETRTKTTFPKCTWTHREYVVHEVENMQISKNMAIMHISKNTTMFSPTCSRDSRHIVCNVHDVSLPHSRTNMKMSSSFPCDSRHIVYNVHVVSSLHSRTNMNVNTIVLSVCQVKYRVTLTQLRFAYSE